MRKLSIISSSIFILLFFAGCEKEIEPLAEFLTPGTDKAQLKINNNSIYRANPGVQISLNNTRVSNVITARTPFPGGGYNTGGDSRPDYLSVNPGQTTLSIAIPKAATNVDSVTLFTTTLQLEAGKNYTAHITDTAANTKVVLTEDDITPAEPGFSKYRFINLMPNVPAIDLYYGTTRVASNVAYLSMTQTFTLPVPTTALAWTIREAGTAPTSTALATYTSINTNLSTRTYTAFAVGYKGITATTDPRRPFISFLLTR